MRSASDCCKRVRVGHLGDPAETVRSP